MPPRTLASLLMLLTGVAHVVNFLALGLPREAAGLGLFGLLYLGIGVLLRRPGRLGLWLGVAIPAVGGLGGLQLLRTAGFSPLMLAYVLVDAAVVAICVALLVRGPGRAAA